ncbi:uncharacterized protein [Centruroides vittatus]|uniref:uncharacterized protein n=1 Tax=Centruroides vittatus TaxID=120091 RepID=UPI00350EBE04
MMTNCRMHLYYYQVAICLVLFLLTDALPPPQQAELYKDDNGNYKINYSVETDKGVISVRQHHRNLDAADDDSSKLPSDIVETDPLPPVKKYYPAKTKLNRPPPTNRIRPPPTEDLPPPSTSSKISFI